MICLPLEMKEGTDGDRFDKYEDKSRELSIRNNVDYIPDLSGVHIDPLMKGGS